MISVKFDKLVYDVQEGTRVIDFIKKELTVEEDTILACRISNEVKSLDYAFERNCTLELVDYTTSDGSRIYIRGLTFILIKAFEELYPEVRLLVDYSLGHSLFCEDDNGNEITEIMIEKVMDRMKEIVAEDLPFIKLMLPIEEARELYQKHNRLDKIELLANRMKPYVSVYSCGETYNYFYGVMPISTKYMKYFNIEKYEMGLILEYPRRSNPTKVAKIRETKKLYNTYQEYDNIHRVLNVANVAELNNWVRSGNLRRTYSYFRSLP